MTVSSLRGYRNFSLNEMLNLYKEEPTMDERIDLKYMCPLNRTLILNPVRFHPCNHIFDESALKSWTNERTTCPYCSQNISEAINDKEFEKEIAEYVRNHPEIFQGGLSLEDLQRKYQSEKFNDASHFALNRRNLIQMIREGKFEEALLFTSEVVDVQLKDRYLLICSLAAIDHDYSIETWKKVLDICFNQINHPFYVITFLIFSNFHFLTTKRTRIEKSLLVFLIIAPLGLKTKYYFFKNLLSRGWFPGIMKSLQFNMLLFQKSKDILFPFLSDDKKLREIITYIRGDLAVSFLLFNRNFFLSEEKARKLLLIHSEKWIELIRQIVPILTDTNYENPLDLFNSLEPHLKGLFS